MANKMADKKKNASQDRMVSAAAPARSGEKEKETSKNAKAVVRERESKPVRRDNKQPSETQLRFRNNRFVRFVRDSYHELRYKVTWPTFEEARNMTFMVLLISAAVAAVLGVADVALLQLHRLITGN